MKFMEHNYVHRFKSTHQKNQMINEKYLYD